MPNLYLKIWWFCNRKPNRPLMTYFSVVMSWFVLGMVFMGGFTLVCLRITYPWVGLLLMALTIICGVSGLIIDYKEKYVDAVHNNYSRRRKEIAERLGKKI